MGEKNTTEGKLTCIEAHRTRRCIDCKQIELLRLSTFGDVDDIAKVEGEEEMFISKWW